MSPEPRLECGVDSPNRDGIELLANTLSDMNHLHTELKEELTHRDDPNDYEDIQTTLTKSLQFVNEDLVGEPSPVDLSIEIIATKIHMDEPTKQELSGVHETLKTIQTDLSVLHTRFRDTPMETRPQTQNIIRLFITRCRTAEYVVSQFLEGLSENTSDNDSGVEHICENDCPIVSITPISDDASDPTYCPHCGEKYVGKREVTAPTQ